jgi:hypothetical protein
MNSEEKAEGISLYSLNKLEVCQATSPVNNSHVHKVATWTYSTYKKYLWE